MKDAFRISRRRVIQGTAAGAALLPFVPLLEASAQSAERPKRILFFYSSNGTIYESWLPTMNGQTLVLSPILEPLEPYSDRLLAVGGMDYKVCIEKGEQSGHYGGMNTALTGAPALIVDKNDPDAASLPNAASIDQIIGKQVSEGLKFRSIEAGIQVVSHNATVACTAHAGPNQPIYPENDPQQIFHKIFDGFQPDGSISAEAQQRLTERKSVIDVVREDLNRLNAKLPNPERQKLDAHLSAIRQLENSLSAAISADAIAACAVPDDPQVEDPWENDDVPTLGRIQMDLLVMALACDLTRVGTLQYGRAGAQHRFSWLGPEFQSDPDNGPNDATSGLHGLAHNEANPDSRAKLVKSHRWYASEMKLLLDRLSAIPEGDGTMLDNTLVVWFNEMGTGGSHSLVNTPWVIAGNVNQHFSTGQVVEAPSGTAHNGLLMSLCHAMGVEPARVGDDDYGREPLSGLT